MSQIDQLQCIEFRYHEIHARLQRLVGKWSPTVVDMNEILLELKNKNPYYKEPKTLENHVFDWNCIRLAIINDAERLVANVESIYHFAYQYFNGNSVLHAKHFDSILGEISIAATELEGSCLIAALWIGHLGFNANGIFLGSFLGMIRSTIKIITAIIREEGDFHFSNVDKIKAKSRFILSKVTSMLSIPLKHHWTSKNHQIAKELKQFTRAFVSSVHDFLQTIENTDLHLIQKPQFKNSGEISLLMYHFERLHGVVFPLQPQLQYQFYPTVGRASNCFHGTILDRGFIHENTNRDSSIKRDLIGIEFNGTPLKNSTREVIISEETLHQNPKESFDKIIEKGRDVDGVKMGGTESKSQRVSFAGETRGIFDDELVSSPNSSQVFIGDPSFLRRSKTSVSSRPDRVSIRVK